MQTNIIKEALGQKKKALSEYESKKLLSEYGVPVVEESLSTSPGEAVEAAEKIGWPVVLKACGTNISHKTEMKLIELNVTSAEQVEKVFEALMEKAGENADGILVQKMETGERELVAGLTRDVVFGPCVMFGAGGIFTEVYRDVSFRVAPLEKRDAAEMLVEVRASAMLGAFRGMKPADAETLCSILIGIGRLGVEHQEIKEIDVNPIILTPEGRPVAVDALVALRNE